MDLDPDGFGGKNPYYKLDESAREELYRDTLADPEDEDVSDEQLNIVIGDTLEMGTSYKEAARAVEAGLANPNRLTEGNQVALGDYLAKADTAVVMDLLNRIVEEYGRDPSPLEF